MNENAMKCEEYVGNIREEKREKPSIKVTWKDNGQMVLAMMCYPYEVKALKELLKFVGDISVDEIIL